MTEFTLKHSIPFENNSDVYITKTLFAPQESNFGVVAATSSGVVHISDATHFEPLIRIQSGFPDISELCAFGSSVWVTSENSKQILEFDCRSLRGKATQHNATARFDAHDNVTACAVGGATGGDSTLMCGCENGNLQWFDRRSRRPVVLEDTHSEAVSQLLFARQSNVAYSGGLDGLVCEIDTSLGDEDALSATVDAEGGAVQHLAFGGKHENSLSCVSHNERFSLFRRSTMTPLVTLSDPRKALENLSARTIDYTVASRYSPRIEK
jgi:WD40 repeat protein